ncbi:hypothetical protein E0Z10_g7534 [Xylaria hypoxylon]|uniref:Uncharacterized protein n=1 Tax=Xylaria hypoxylon TaxID=37992 RepID=A0A4Z0YP86_9PEZI|nr:hypothetical protein E0Z10_g7534 [Xylaria hypoxylon]
MLFASRILAQRSAALRSLTRRQAVSARLASVSRRGYAGAHGAAQKTSDTPWLLGAVGFTAAGLAYLRLGSAAPSGAHASADHHKKDEHKDEHKETSSSPSESESESKSDSQQDENPDNSAPKGAADPNVPGKASQSGQNVPPPSADNTDLATKQDEKKQGHEEFKETTRAGETKAATSSSTAPSKKTAAEDPREDPKKGEGEAVQKGSSKD